MAFVVKVVIIYCKRMKTTPLKMKVISLSTPRGTTHILEGNMGGMMFLKTHSESARNLMILSYETWYFNIPLIAFYSVHWRTIIGVNN
jgi:hypothetical protein